MKRIIYTNEEGGLSIIIPSGELPLEDVALKDVPKGIPFKIIDTADVPSDRVFRDAWEADTSDFDGIGMGYDDWAKMKSQESQND